MDQRIPASQYKEKSSASITARYNLIQLDIGAREEILSAVSLEKIRMEIYPSGAEKIQ